MNTLNFEIIKFIKKMYGNVEGGIPLHSPVFCGKEKEFVIDCIDSTYVSTVGNYVNRFENDLCRTIEVEQAVAVVNGTSALHAALIVAGVEPSSEVLTQPLTFVATANAISYCGALPVFLDIEADTLGLNPESVVNFLKKNTEIKGGKIFNKKSGRRIAACVPVHTFGHPCRIDDIVDICNDYGVPVVEDAAEALGSKYKNKFCGTFGLAGVLSFNGNKIITSGGGGAVVTNDVQFADKVRYITTTAKKSHPYLYEHTEVGYNYRMPNLNAALACAQLENLNIFLGKKRKIADSYQEFFEKKAVKFIGEPRYAKSNFWLNSIIMSSVNERDRLINYAQQKKVQLRPAWTLLCNLPMYSGCYAEEIPVSNIVTDKIVSLPSSALI